MSHYHALRCDAPFCGEQLYGGDHGHDRQPMHGIRADAKAEGWYVQVAGIAPNLRRKQGSYDFCPACVARWTAEDANGVTLPCPKCASPRCPELRGDGACPADYARSLPVLIDGIVYAADGKAIGAPAAATSRAADLARIDAAAAERECVCGDPKCAACWRRMARGAAGGPR